MMKTIATGIASAALILGTVLAPLPTIGAAQAKRARPPCRDGKDRRVHMTNATSFTIRQLYGSTVNVRDWQENVLHGIQLRPGRSAYANWDDGSCQCEFDVKAVYSDGDTTIKSALDVCRLRSFRFTE